MTVSVNGIEIPTQAIDAEVQYHPAADLEAARQQAAAALVVRELLLQEAVRLGLSEDGDDLNEEAEGALVQRLLDREVSVPEADADACRRYYDQNPRRFRSADIFEACHILFPAHPEDAAKREEARKQAETTIAELIEHPGRFADLARARSACPSSAQGGNLGQVTRGQTVPEFETFLHNLEPGQLSPVPVPTRFGFHVLRLDRRIDGAALPFEQVERSIAEYLRERSWRRAVHQYIQVLAGKADIGGVDLGGANSSLVQ